MSDLDKLKVGAEAMPARSSSVIRTLLDSAEPMTEEEHRRLNEERVENSLNALIAYAKQDRPFALNFCQRLADEFGPDDELSGLIQKRIRSDRKGKPSGRHKTKWGWASHVVLLAEYGILMEQLHSAHPDLPMILSSTNPTRENVLGLLAKRWGLSGDNASKKIANKISAARKVVKRADLSCFGFSDEYLRKLSE